MEATAVVQETPEAQVNATPKVTAVEELTAKLEFVTQQRDMLVAAINTLKTSFDERLFITQAALANLDQKAKGN